MHGTLANPRPATAARVWRHRRGAALAVLGAAAAGFVAVLAWLRLDAALDDLRAARELLHTAERAAGEGDSATLDRLLTEAEQRLGSARATLQSSPPLRVARWLPGVRQNLDAASAVTDRAFSIAGVARRLSSAAAPVLDGEAILDEGRVQVERLRSLRSETSNVRELLEQLAPVELPSRWLLLGRVERAAEELERGQDEVRRAVVAADDSLHLVTDVVGADGPRRYVIAAANAAEMRGAGGMILSYAVISSDNGVVRLAHVGPEDELRLEEPADVDLPADYAARYREMQPTQEWRNANLSADFTVGGPVLAAMYEAATGEPVDGVIQIDSMALADLLDVIGAVEVEGLGTVDAGNAVALTLNEAYFRFPGLDDRQDALARVAGSAFERLLGTTAPPLALVEALQLAAQGRHLLVYSTNPALQARIERSGPSGALPAGVDLFHLAVQNFSGNKLDYYLDTSIDVRGERPPHDPASIDVTISVANRAPAGVEPRYVFGPYDDSLQAGQYRGHGILYVPAGVELRTVSGAVGVSSVVSGTESGRPVVTFAVDASAGTTATITLHLSLPPSDDGCARDVVLIPSPRVRPTTASLDLAAPGGGMQFDGMLTGTERVPGDC